MVTTITQEMYSKYRILDQPPSQNQNDKFYPEWKL